MDSIVCLDYGSHTIKAGVATNIPSADDPRVVTPSAVVVTATNGTHDTRRPINAGAITDSQGFERLLNYILYELLGRVYGEEGPLLVGEPLFAPKRDRELLAHLAFEVFNVPGLFLQDTASLSLYAVGRLQGCVVELGHGKCDVAAIQDGQTLHTSTRRLPFSGEFLTSHLQSLMAKRGVSLSPAQAEELKERCCRASVALPHAHEAGASGGAAHAPVADTSYTLPDGQTVTIGSEGRQLAELLFHPSAHPDLAEAPDIVAALIDAVSDAADSGSRRLLYGNAYLSGGGACIENLSVRFREEYRLALPVSADPDLCVTPEFLPGPRHTAKYAPWIGASILAKVLQAQSNPNSHFMTKFDYEEWGPFGVHKKL